MATFYADLQTVINGPAFGLSNSDTAQRLRGP